MKSYFFSSVLTIRSIFSFLLPAPAARLTRDPSSCGHVFSCWSFNNPKLCLQVSTCDCGISNCTYTIAIHVYPHNLTVFFESRQIFPIAKIPIPSNEDSNVFRVVLFLLKKKLYDRFRFTLMLFVYEFIAEKMHFKTLWRFKNNRLLAQCWSNDFKSAVLTRQICKHFISYCLFNLKSIILPTCEIFSK